MHQYASENFRKGNGLIGMAQGVHKITEDFWGWAADRDMILSITRYCEKNAHLKLKSFLVNAVTCNHDEEGYSLK